MAPSRDSALETIGEGGVGCGEADGPDVAREGDRAFELEERNVTHGALLEVAGVGNNLRHPADLGVRAVVVQLVGPQLYLVVLCAVLPAGRGAKAGTRETGIPVALWRPTSVPDLSESTLHPSFIL